MTALLPSGDIWIELVVAIFMRSDATIGFFVCAKTKTGMIIKKVTRAFIVLMLKSVSSFQFLKVQLFSCICFFSDGQCDILTPDIFIKPLPVVPVGGQSFF